MPMKEIEIQNVKFNSRIYPRATHSTSTIDRYADAMEAGDVFPPITLLEGTNELLDGKHRFEAAKKRGAATIAAEIVKLPSGMSAKYYAATLSSRHGDRMSNSDLKALAIEEYESAYERGDKLPKPDKWGKALAISERSVYRWVSHIIGREKAQRAEKAWRLCALGWTQAEAGELLGVDRSSITKEVKNCHLAKIHTDLGDDWNEKGIAEWCQRTGVNHTAAWAAAMMPLDDAERMRRLEIKTQPYDVWNFSSCHDLMGDSHPGRIPGEIVAHVLYFFTKPGQLIVDPMAGSGTTSDACLLMGRKCRTFDIDARHDRCDIINHDILQDGWPDAAKNADLVFWDPPYFSKMDNSEIGEDGYIENSISKLSPEEYVSFFAERFKELKSINPKAQLAFLMSDWDSENAKNPEHAGHQGIWLWDYADILRNAGWQIARQIQCPLPTQQVHPDIVNKFRESRRLARLCRWLLIAK